MLTFELSSDSLEIPEDAHTSLSQILFGCSLLGQEYCNCYKSILDNNETATWHINMP